MGTVVPIGPKPDGADSKSVLRSSHNRQGVRIPAGQGAGKSPDAAAVLAVHETLSPAAPVATGS